MGLVARQFKVETKSGNCGNLEGACGTTLAQASINDINTHIYDYSLPSFSINIINLSTIIT